MKNKYQYLVKAPSLSRSLRLVFLAVGILTFFSISAFAQVELVLNPSSSTVDVGDNFTITLQVVAGTNEIDGIETYLNYDPALLTVNSASFAPSNPFSIPVIDPGSDTPPAGEIDAASGLFGGSFTTGTFDYLNVNFTATAAGNTSIVFAFEGGSPARTTLLSRNSQPVSFTTSDASITINSITNTPPTVSITAPANNTSFNVGDNVSITATASDDGSVTQVEFFDGGNSLGVDNTSPYTATLNGISSGSHTLTAVATDNGNLSTTSDDVIITAQATATTPTINIGGPTNKIVAEGGSISIPISATDLDGDNLTVTVTSISDEPQLLQSANTGTQVDPFPIDAAGFLAVNNINNVAGNYSADIDFAPVFGDGGGANGDGDGKYTITVEVTDGTNTVTETFELTVTDTPQSLSAVSTTRIEAESFDNQGPAYTGSGTNGIGVEVNNPGVTNIGFTNNGDFAEYLINVPQSGTYDFTFAVAKSNGIDGTLTINGGPASIQVNDATGGWQTYIDFTVSVDLIAGQQNLRFDWSSANTGFLFNMDYFDIDFVGDAAPEVSITAPNDGDTFVEGSTVTVTVDATDDVGVTQVELFNNGNASLGTDATPPYEFTIPNATGTYTLTAVASDGTASTTSAPVMITSAPANTAPVVTIDAPTNNLVVTRGTDITLTGTVIDAEESGLAAGLQWSSGDAQFSTVPNNGIGNNITAQFVTPGTQTLTASVTDGGGLSGSDQITVEVSNPAVNIAFPTENQVLTSTNLQLVWTSSNVLYDFAEHYHIYVNPPIINDIDTDTRISTANQIGQEFWDLTAADGLQNGQNTIVIRAANQFHDEFLADQNDPTSFIQDIVNFTINAPDVTPPVITLNGANPLNLTVGQAYTEFGATATDDVDGDLTANVVINSTTVDVNTIGSYQVTYNVSDVAGNAATEVIRTVNVSSSVELPDPCENTLYRINVGGPAIASADATPLGWSQDQGNFPGANNAPFLAANTGGGSTYNGDAGSAHPGAIIMTDPSVPTSAPAAIFNTERYDLAALPEMKWEFPVDPGTEVQVTLLFAELFGTIDQAGERIFDVAIEGVVLPAFDDIDPFAIAGAKGAFSRSATLTVNDGTLDIEFIHGVENPALKGIQICDLSGGTDNTPPVITLLGDSPLNLTVGDVYTDPGATALDDVDGDITANIIVGGDVVDPNTADTYIVTYNVSDAAGNPATEVTRSVIVSEVGDITPPVIILLGDSPLNLTIGDTYTDPGANAFDNVDGDITANIIVGGDIVDPNTANTYLVTYNVSDAAGNPATEVTRSVIVSDPVDNTPPVITLLGDNPLNLTVGDAYTDPGATALDDVDGDITANIVVGGEVVDPNTADTYFITYNVSDAAGNPATEVIRTVTVAPPVELPDACENTLYRINVGGPTLASADATLLGWSQDQGVFGDATNSPYLAANSTGGSLFSGNSGSAHPGAIITTDPTVPTSAPADIFNTERYDTDSAPEMKWEFPVDAGTEVQVTLLFAELFGQIDQAGERVFDVAIEGVVLPAFDDIDPFAIAGPKGAFTRSATLTVTDGTLDIEFIHGVENPALKGIQICSLSGPVDNTPPVITLLGDNPLNLTVGDIYTDPGATALDDIDGDITANIIIGGDIVDPNTIGTYTVTYNVSDAAGNPATEVTRTVVVNEADAPCAYVAIDPSGNNLLTGSTFSNGFIITNNSQGTVQITSVSFDLSTAIYPNIVFDPVGTAGDATAKCLDITSETGGDGSVGLTIPGNGGTGTDPDCVAPFAGETVVGNGGYSVLNVDFTDFEPGESINFAIDVDPTSIEAFNSAGNAGAISGLELIGTTVTVVFSNGQSATGELYRVQPSSNDGAENYLYPGSECSAPTLSVLGATGTSTVPGFTDATVVSESQTVQISGTPGESVSLLVLESTIEDVGPGITPSEFEANKVQVVQEFDAVIGAGGTVDIPVSLTDVASGEIYHLVAVKIRTDDGICGLGTCNTSEVWRLKIADTPIGDPIALIEITPGGGLGASTYGGSNSFQVTNQSTGNLQITDVSIDFSTGILPDMVFDPVGNGGDATAQCFTAGSTATDVQLVVPADACVTPFSQARNGGFDIMSLSFTEFDPAETFTFSVDVDPNSIQGVAGAGNAGAVSGYELIGTTVTVSFNDGSVLTGSLYEDGSLGGAQVILTANAPATPSISVVDVVSSPATVGDLNQIVTVSGTPGDYVSLLVMDSRLFIASGDPPFNVTDPTYYANEAMSGKALYTATIGAGGTVDIPITLLVTPSGNTTPDGGLNQIVAVSSATPYVVDQAVSGTSNVFTLRYDPTINMADISLSVTREGVADYSGDYTVKFYEVGASTPSYDLIGTADPAGLISLTGIAPGTYEVAIKYPNCLQLVETLTIVSGNNSADMGELPTGDINNSNNVDILDFSLLVNSFMLQAGDPGYNPNANLNGLGQVDILDFSLLVNSFNVTGEVPSGL